MCDCRSDWVMCFRRDCERAAALNEANGVVWSRHINLLPPAEVELTFAECSWARTDPVDGGRREFIAGLGSAAAWPLAARATPAIPVIGFLHSTTLEAISPERIAAFRAGLAGFGLRCGPERGHRFDPVKSGLVPSLNRPGGNSEGCFASIRAQHWFKIGR